MSVFASDVDVCEADLHQCGDHAHCRSTGTCIYTCTHCTSVQVHPICLCETFGKTHSMSVTNTGGVGTKHWFKCCHTVSLSA